MTIEHHLAEARNHVRSAIALSRQAEQHAWRLNQDDIDHLTEAASNDRRFARKHIRLAYLAGWRQSTRRAA